MVSVKPLSADCCLKVHPGSVRPFRARDRGEEAAAEARPRRSPPAVA